MFENYTEGGRRVIFFARYEASQYGSPYIEAEHLLLGILRQGGEIAKRFPRVFSVEEIRAQIEKTLNIRAKTSTSIDLPLSEAAKRSLAIAAEEASQLRCGKVGPEHLLLGLLHDEGSVAAQILLANGMDVENLRHEIAQLQSARTFAASGREVSMVGITSNPCGAEIEVDGRFIGTTPAEVPLASGNWKVRIAKSGFVAWDRTVLILPGGKQNIAVDLIEAE